MEQNRDDGGERENAYLRNFVEFRLVLAPIVVILRKTSKLRVRRSKLEASRKATEA